MNADRYFDPALRDLARQLYETVAGLPLLCPHGHVDPLMFADPAYDFGTPAQMIVTPDHYIFRMLYSQGIPLQQLGIAPQTGAVEPVDWRAVWQVFAEHFYLFRGTPTGIWLADELAGIFGVTDQLSGETAGKIYDHIAQCLGQAEFRPRALYERFNIEVLCTTDAATDTLQHHQAVRHSGWGGRILPTFRPDALVNLDTPDWRTHLDKLSAVSQIDITGYPRFIQALENRRAFFKTMGAVATDHAALTAYTARLSSAEAGAIFTRALSGQVSGEDARRFTGHMLMEMARMSVEDGLVMQLHVGSFRNHNVALFNQFGRDKGADIPVMGEFTRDLHPLLNAHGADGRLRLILFTLDEATYARELAPLAGHYPAVFLGPPWWFHDSLNGMRRYFDQVMETAGLYNTAGFNDDTRAFPSIPARHDLWRRAACNWLAGLLARGVIDDEAAQAMAWECAYGLAKRVYRL